MSPTRGHSMMERSSTVSPRSRWPSMVASEGETVRDLAYPQFAKKNAGIQYYSVLNIIFENYIMFYNVL